MKFAIVGAGAIGSFLAARMTRAGIDVTLVGRGSQLAAIRRGGVRVVSPVEPNEFTSHVKIAASIDEVGIVDVVILAVKSHSLMDVAPALPALFHESTVVVTTQNGIPWWYFDHAGPPFEGLQLERLDPGGMIAKSIAAERVVGSLVYFATEVMEPGLVRHVEGDRMSLGEPRGGPSERSQRIAAALIRAGLRAPVVPQIRREIWVKLLGNVAMNPISALTGATLAEISRDPDMRAIAREVMVEAELVAQGLGLRLPITIDQRMAGAAKVGEHKTSMLQDLEAGRPLELEAVVGAVIDVGERLGVDVTRTRTLYACTKLAAALRVGRPL